MNAQTIPDEQHDRRRFLGGSDAAAALGYSQYRTPYDVYLAKTAEQPGEMDPARRKFLDRRKRWEPVVVQMLREEFDAEIVQVNQRYVDPAVPYFAAEIDFEWMHRDGSGDVVELTVQNGEVKTVHPWAFGERHGWGDEGSADIPIEYEAQVQHGLGVTGRRVCAVAALVGIDSLVFYRVPRNDEVLPDMRAILTKFWVEHVLAKVAPDPQTITDLHRMFAKAAGTAIAAPEDLASKALRLRAIHASIDAMELEAEALEFDVKNFMRANEELLVEGRKLVTWKEQKWSRFDQAGLKEKHPALAKEFTKAGTHRVFKTLRST